MLSFPLRKLAKSFEVDTIKGVFPYRFPNGENFTYVGTKPSYDFYNSKDISLEEYKLLNPNDWDLKLETLRYLESDVRSLYEVIMKFAESVYELEKLNITDSLTIASLAFNAFKANYLKGNTYLSKIRSDLHNEIRSAYYGGRVEVYKPHGMLNPMPTGNGVLTGEKDLNKLFGIVKANIVCPDDLYCPILPYRTKKGGLICPTGSWTDWYFSEELKMAVSYGYTVEVVKAVVFDKNDGLFDDYVNKYYNIKSHETGPKRATAKSMLVSLYGRMGLRPTFDVTRLVTTDVAEGIMKNYDVTDSYILNEDKKLEILRYSTIPSEDKAKVNNNLIIRLEL
ncbi:DNA polymerase type B, organellar and viral-domain-containing protein [Jimgerdemannia flammicorona]|uniref:DNA-directed DNA polymerase n=1 Tax=Jimgerdemannia flammicorona TaxID=994334 RepID=A0A433QP20_9FUNG|nr:DNA polymerase type B, organellar and viral-domain-containing protein [Jimgerdemannia flammicorona]